MMSDKNLLEKIRELIPKIPDRQVLEMVTEFVRVLDLHVDEIAALRASLAAAQRERDEARRVFADELVARLTKYESEASERYKTPNFRIVKNVCHDLKWFVDELLKKPKEPPHDPL